MTVRTDYSPAGEPGGGRALTKFYAVDALEHATAINGKQDGDADLTAIAALTPSDDDVIQRKASAWVNRTMAQFRVDIAAGAMTSPTFVTPVLGTPASGNLANCTFPTLNQNTTGSAASLTTARAINGVNFNGTAAITIVPRVGTTASSATPTVDMSLYEQYNITALAAAITSWTISNGADGLKVVIRIKDNGTARALAFGSPFRAIGVTLPTTTVLSKTLYLGCIYNGADSKLDVVAVGQEA